ncbi:MAG TPA: MMPL family transporter [Polyangia bacterium]|nr:MMPL family transporter [Polyangia bacterium]
MLDRLAREVARRRRAVVAGGVVVALAALLAAHGMSKRLGYAVFFDPRAESTRATEAARTLFGDTDADIVALYRLPPELTRARGGITPEARSALAAAMARAAGDPSTAQVLGAPSLGGDRFVSRDGRSTFVVVSLHGSPQDKLAALARIAPGLTLAPARGPTIAPRLGGLVPAGRALTGVAERSLARGERIALPATGILLVVIFGSVVAALLPVVIGGLAILYGLGLLGLASRIVTIDAFAINVVTILGLGVAIDYALFIISRYREEIARRGPGDDAREAALRCAVGTAGRSVLFSGLTVAASLSGLLVYGQPFLRSVGLGGIAVVLLSTTLALVMLPAMLAILGPRFERGRLPRLGRRAQSDAHWRRLAHAVMRWRVAVTVVVTVGLVILALPFGRLHPARSDVRALPPDVEARQVVEDLGRDFPAISLTPMAVLVSMNGTLVDEDRLAELFDYTRRLAKLPAVDRVESVLSYAGAKTRDQAAALEPALTTVLEHPSSEKAHALATILRGRHTIVRVISAANPDSPAGQKLVDDVRTLPPPPGATARVFGQAAAERDFAAGLEARAPAMLVIVVAAMLALLYRAFRSIVLPIKAVLVTTLSLTASFGAIVFVFQEGRLEHLLRFHALGTIDAALPVVMFAIVFGLSMDYEVLIISRIREAWLRTHDTRGAIVDGLARTGRLVTGAAAIMIVVFSAFAAAPVVFIKALGLGMALAVALDATVVRLLLVPAAMALLGRLSWIGWRDWPTTGA